MILEADPPERGELEDEKRGEAAEPGKPQPEAAEVESARLLAGKVREELEAEGFSWERIQELADEYIARDLGEDPADFLAWARDRGAR